MVSLPSNRTVTETIAQEDSGLPVKRRNQLQIETLEYNKTCHIFSTPGEEAKDDDKEGSTICLGTCYMDDIHLDFSHLWICLENSPTS